MISAAKLTTDMRSFFMITSVLIFSVCVASPARSLTPLIFQSGSPRSKQQPLILPYERNLGQGYCSNNQGSDVTDTGQSRGSCIENWTKGNTYEYNAQVSQFCSVRCAYWCFDFILFTGWFPTSNFVKYDTYILMFWI